jgi:formylglycine-generating enzyme required for sulfatase activity
MIRIKNLFGLVVILATVILFESCGKEQSPTTGWNYNDRKNGGFEVVPYEEQETGPGLVLIEGGTFTMGRTEQDVNYEWSNQPRRVTVSSFYIDQTEVRNLDYLEYLHWLNRVYKLDYPRIVQKALPDTLVWRNKLAYNEPLTELYLRHPAYRDYPVVGINWLQATDYCKWRTDRVNEYILVIYGIQKHYVGQTNDDHFNTDAYFAGKYPGNPTNRQLVDLSPNGDTRNPRMEDGILLPRYRLPTEAEWEFAALGLIGNTLYERVVERRLYPWNGHIARTDAPSNYGDFVANFRRGRGDYMGTAGSLNDAASIPAPVYAYWPNDYGLYNMAGNVAEWVMDVYRPLTFEDFSDFNSFRGNVYKTYVRDNAGKIDDKLTYTIYDYQGILDWLQGQGAYQDNGFVKKLQNRSPNGQLDPREQDLLDKVIEKITKAKAKNDERKYDEASDLVEDALIDIDAAPDAVEIANELLKGISDFIVATPGELRKRNVTIEENLERRNYRKSNNINYLDGDYASNYTESGWTNWQDDDGSKQMYDYSITSMINDKARVYKGGSWKDGQFWISPGARRFLDERQSTDFIGFRCAMTRVGSPIGNY